MIDSSVKVGDVVFAGDLVKVQHGTKYFNISYFDFTGDTVGCERAHRNFEVLSSSTDRFLFWEISDAMFCAGQVYDGGLTADISAYAHKASDICVTYYGNGGKIGGQHDSIIDADNIVSHDIFLSNIDGTIQQVNSYVDYTALCNDFIRQKYRFVGWKKDDYGDLIGERQQLQLNGCASLYAQWHYLVNLTLNPPPSNGKPGKVILPYESDLTSITFDQYAAISVRAMPDDYHHLTKWTMTYDGRTITDVPVEYDPRNPAPIEAYDMSAILYDDTTITPEYAIDRCFVNVVNTTQDKGTIEVSYDGKTETFDGAKEISCDWNTVLKIKARPKDFEVDRFSYWTGDVALDFTNNMIIVLTADQTVKSVYATFMTLNRYTVTTIVNIPAGAKICHDNKGGTSETYTAYVEGDAVKLTAKLEYGFKVVSWKVNSIIREGATGTTVNVTDSINNNIVVELTVDTLLITDNYIPIVDSSGELLDYSGSNWQN